MPPPATALVVDDERLMMSVLGRHLTSLGVTWRGAPTAEEALAAAETDPPAVAFVDLRLPGMSGMDLLAELKRTHPDVRLVVISGAREFETVRRAFHLGARDYLSKPFTVSDVERVLREIEVLR